MPHIFAGGSYLAPSYYSSIDIYANFPRLVYFVASLGLGVFCTGLVGVIAIILLESQRQEQSKYQTSIHLFDSFSKVAPFGCLGGLIYYLSSMSAFAALFLGTALAVTSTLVQTSLLVSGVWGITLFKELKGASVPVFFLGGAVMVGGAGLISYASSTVDVSD